ncbi:MAG: glycosyltransferase family 4 protein [Patescibacteria group bacterium]|mgnify:CR=1 FL=1
MRLLIAADIFPPVSGGPATYAVTLANALKKEGTEVRIVTLTPDADTDMVSVPVESVEPRRKFWKYVQYTRLVYKHAKLSDCIYAMGPVNAGFPAWIVSILLGKPLAVKVVGDYAWEQGAERFGVNDGIDAFQKKRGYGFFVEMLRMIEQWVVRRADRVIVPSDYLKTIVRGWGARPDRITLIYNAIDIMSAEEIVKPEGEQWIVSVGRLARWKGMQTLIELMPHILSQFPRAQLKIVGDGPQYDALEDRIEALHLSDSVQLLGDLPRSETLSYIQSADVFVLNSGYEGLSHTLLEAISFHTPILASTAGGNTELIVPGKNGELFPYNDADRIREHILARLSAPSSAYDGNGVVLTDEEKKFFEQFQLATMITRTKRILEQVCEHS